jgi:hypothetical protein
VKAIKKLLDKPEVQLLQKARMTTRALRRQPDDGKLLDDHDMNAVLALGFLEQNQQRTAGGKTKHEKQQALLQARDDLWRQLQADIVARRPGLSHSAICAHIEKKIASTPPADEALRKAAVKSARQIFRVLYQTKTDG